ncbi:MAG: peptide chain release factor N(5)-glutamine methyltransferase [Phycisphaerales bacterium]|nr:MAG: peptide chain release factor N(5)-glutamine methyltransferase [Phycisphaerales bacterium]
MTETPKPAPTTPASEDAWTTRRLLAWMSSTFAEREMDSPRLLAELLLTRAIGCDRMSLYTDADRPASNAERDALRALVGRALKHEPVQYIAGEAWFYGIRFTVDPRVLIPRPATETLVDLVLDHFKPRVHEEPPVDPEVTPEPQAEVETEIATEAQASPPPAPPSVRLADIGVGSGAIVCALLKHLPNATAVATDISQDAIELAKANAESCGVLPRVEFRRGDLLEPLAGEPPLDAIVSNPPYIPDHEWAKVEPNVKNHEPTHALRAGPDGLRFVRPLIEHAPALLAPGGLLAIEIADSTADAVLQLAHARPDLKDCRIVNDLDGLPRVLVATRA